MTKRNARRFVRLTRRDDRRVATESRLRTGAMPPRTGGERTPDPAETSEVSAARPAYGDPEIAVSSERAPSSVLPLLVLCLGLAPATGWFVALPAFDAPPAKRSCEVYLLKSGSTVCKPLPGSRQAGVKPRPGGTDS